MATVKKEAPGGQLLKAHLKKKTKTGEIGESEEERVKGSEVASFSHPLNLVWLN